MAVGEWDQRQLCSDGGCVGVIGPDGTCKVCGRAAANWGDERNRGLNLADVAPEDDAAEDDDDDEDDDDLEDGELAEGDGDEGDDEYDDGEDEDGEDDDDEDDDDLDEADDVPGRIAAAAPVEWTERELCSDGGCIGVIGDDGRCKVCGKTARGAAPRLAVEIETADAVQATDAVVQTADATIHTGAPAEPAGVAPEPTEDPDSKRA